MKQSEITGRILALDTGEKRVGVALSDETRTIASQSFLLSRQDIEGTCSALITLINDFNVGLIVLGHPQLMNGSAGSQAIDVQQIKIRFEQLLTIPVILWDERLTSKEAERVLIEGGVRRQKRKLVVDKMSAMLILQSFLDSLLPDH